MAKPKALTRLQKMLRSDGALCVTFVNTACDQRKTLASYDDLFAWGVEVGALDPSDAERLTAAAGEHPGNATDVARHAATLRRRLERILLALAERKRPAASDFGPFNSELRRVMSARQLVASGRGYRWTWGETGDDDFDRMLWPVLPSAGVLLASGDREQVRQCPGKGCGLLFVARGAGRHRKWCGITCRNRTNSRDSYRRKHRGESERRKRTRRGRRRPGWRATMSPGSRPGTRRARGQAVLSGFGGPERSSMEKT